jgi:hypothetical protein
MIDAKVLEAINARDDYIALLFEEWEEFATFAYVHGWKSSRVEAGEKARDRIIKADYEAGILP